MTSPKRIAVATFGRSDFSILRPLCRLLVDHPSFNAGWWVGGAHFEATSGHTVDDVESAGLPIWARIDTGEHGRSGPDTVQAMAAQMTGFAAAASGTEAAGVTLAERHRADLVLILGDRYEAVSAGLAMVPLGVPVGHISGGSITEGAIDDVFRHCLTKIAAVHFCDLAPFARRIHLMGESPERIFTTGALGLDAFAGVQHGDFGAFTERFDLPGLTPGYVLATLHPETGCPDCTGPMTVAMLDALEDTGRQVVITYPNADPGSDTVIDLLQARATNPRIHLVRGFGADWYPTAMANAALMVGNSSGGIIEAASFGLPVVDIGDRQRGRDHGANVIHCGRDQASIAAALAAAGDPAFAAAAGSGNIYGDGRGAQRVIAALTSIDWDLLSMPKGFSTPDPHFVGALMELG